MPHCTKCGTEVADTAAYCPKCGAPQGETAKPAATGQTPFSENGAATLSYALGWLTGLIFFLLDRRPYVRFHAAQALVLFGGLHIIRIAVGVVFGYGWFIGGWGGLMGFGIGALVLGLLGILTLVLWIVCMVKAYQGQRFKVPLAGDFAEDIAAR